MKKVVLFFAIAIAAVSANAQGVTFGAKAGINVSSFHQSGSSYDSRVGFVGGGFAEMGINEKFAVQAELLYSGEGAKDGSVKYNLAYINVPVLAKYKVAGFGVYLGPQIGFLTSAKAKSGGNSASIKDDLKSTNFSGVLGVEYTFMQCLVASARYQMGFGDVLSNNSGGDKLTTNGFQVTLGYSLHCNKKK